MVILKPISDTSLYESYGFLHWILQLLFIVNIVFDGKKNYF